MKIPANAPKHAHKRLEVCWTCVDHINKNRKEWRRLAKNASSRRWKERNPERAKEINKKSQDSRRSVRRIDRERAKIEKKLTDLQWAILDILENHGEILSVDEFVENMRLALGEPYVEKT
jgi:hypothetical protein